MTPRPPMLRLDIDRIQLHGFGPEHRDAFRAGLEAALAALVAERGLPQGGARPPAVPHVRHQATSADPAVAARETAEALWTAFAAPAAGSGG